LNKILLIGASGFLGNYCFNKLKNSKEFDVEGTCHNNLDNQLIRIDYTDSNSFLKFIKTQNPNCIVWCGGLKDLTITEENYNLALEQNYYPIKTIVEYQKINRNIRFIFISTDYVFDGVKGRYKITDPVNPSTKYGKSKSVAENYIISNSPDYAILRAGAIIGKDSKFFKWITKKLRASETIELFNTSFSPTPIINVFKAIKFLALNNKNGIYHISGKERLTRFEFGVLVKKFINYSKSDLIKIENKNNLYIQDDLSLSISNEFKNFESLTEYVLKLFKYD
tara:strand:+ start:1876 stop:2718 length:843 start_codon:yes stop_codon:yes gene_type:complete